MTTNNEIIRQTLESTLRCVEEAGRTIAEIQLADDKEERRVQRDARDHLVASRRLIRNLFKLYEAKCLKQGIFEFDLT